MGSYATEIVLLAAGLAIACAGFLLWRRRRKTPAERERLRRLAVNATGRIVEGTLTETAPPGADSPGVSLIFYQYWAAGVEYAAAQDVSTLRHLVRLEDCWPGRAATVKYDPHRPANSIIVCELWSGLNNAGRAEQQSLSSTPRMGGG